MQREINEQLIIDWIAALRSGKYKKETGHLRKNKGYCCLGVLCDLQNKGEWIPIEPKFGNLCWNYVITDQYSGAKTVLIAGLTSKDHKALNTYGISASELVVMNDDRVPCDNKQTYTFNEIADTIEEMFGASKALMAQHANKEENV